MNGILNRRAFVFAGQGVQHAGMGKSLYAAYDCVKEVYKKANEIFDFDIKKICFEGDEELLNQTQYAQPAIFTLSMAGVEALKAEGVSPDAVAGFSLGEIAALCAAGCFSMEDGFTIVRMRATAMQGAAETHNGAMVAVINVAPEEIRRACEAVGDVWPVNYNAPMQTVIAGEASACARVTEKLRDYDRAKCIKLNVNAAFHSKFMEEAATEFYESIRDISFQRENIPVYSNVTGDILSVSDYPAYLKQQIVSPVRWVDVVRRMSEDGIRHFIELGSGKTLSGLIKKITKEAVCVPFALERVK